MTLLAGACSGAPRATPTDAPRSPDAGPVSLGDCAAPLTAPPAELGLDPFYAKYLDVGGLPLISSSKVRDAAFPIACDVLVHMLGKHPEIVPAFAFNKIRIGIVAETEVTTDMPEHSDLNTAFPETDWDTRARGLGATIERPLTSVGEENVLELSSDRYVGENILVHELAHTYFELGAAQLTDGSARSAELDALYAAAVQSGAFNNTYAGTNVKEYWAEAVQSFYDANLEAIPSQRDPQRDQHARRAARRRPATRRFRRALLRGR
ncbi:MAG: hypothetical protein JWP01_564 [Myxococcales bacterium]|nr:hypothetical protein [Myxococcales bacterium]